MEKIKRTTKLLQRSAVIITALLLTTATLSAQNLSGDGSPANPYKLSSAADWDRFTEIVAGTNGATKQSDACAIMTDNIPNATERANGLTWVTTMVTGKYKGTFNGAGHTLTISYGTEENRVEDYVAPFDEISNGTIKFLHVDGNIYTRKHASGLAYSVYRSFILGCRSSVYINCRDYIISSPTAPYVRVSGFADSGIRSTFLNCLFDGKFDYAEVAQCIICCFVSLPYENDDAVIFQNCLAAPKSISIDEGTDRIVNAFFYNRRTSTLDNCYYTNNAKSINSDAVQGSLAQDNIDELVTALGSGWEIKNGMLMPLEALNISTVNISSLPEEFIYTDEIINLNYSVVDEDGNLLTEGIHYTATITKDGEPVTEVKDEGDYLLILTAITSGGYAGKKTQKFHVGDGLSIDVNGNYYIVMPETGTKTIMPRGKENGFEFTIYNPNHPSSFNAASDGSIIINAQGYTMSISGKIECVGGNDWVNNAYFEFFNGTKADNSSPSYTTVGSNFHSMDLQFAPDGEQTEISFISGTHPAERFYLTVTLTTIPYTITYNLNGGTLSEGHFTTYTTDMDCLPVVPIREGYVFAGWYTNENLSGTPLKSLRGLVGDKTLFARWKKSLATHTDIFISTPEDVTYNGTSFTPQITVTEGETNIANECEITYSDNLNAGTATITIAAKDESNEYGGIATRTFTIAPAPVTVTAENKTKTYGEADPTLTAKVEGLVNNESADLIKYTLTRAEGENVGDYAISAKGDAKQGNYVVSFVDGKLTIKAKENPEQPENPENPEQPENPENPEQPENPGTPVSSVDSTPSVKVWSSHRTIFIESASDTKYTIIDLNGRTIKSSITKSTKEEIKINKHGIVVVIINGNSYKVAVD